MIDDMNNPRYPCSSKSQTKPNSNRSEKYKGVQTEAIPKKTKLITTEV